MTLTTLLRRFLLLLILAGALPATAPATFVFQLSQVGSDVVVTGSGTLNLAALSDLSSINSGGSQLIPNTAGLIIDPTGNNPIELYAGISGPASFGSGSNILASSSSGDKVGLSGTFSALFVDPTYVSGSLLSSSMTFANMTFSGLGFTPGTYTYTWGSGATADSLTVTSAVPEPSTWALLGFGVLVFLGLGLRSRATGSA